MDSHVIILYDGLCGFCNQSIKFILKNKPSQKLRFASSRSKTGKYILESLNIYTIPETIILVKDGTPLFKSKAVFASMKYLNTNWKYANVLVMIPSRLSDLIYVFIARNRYRIYGHLNSCTLPDETQTNLFLN